ncbi:unnamed protein product [Lactuca virosa]|uniref:Uncharacterized protein n=1 Tax=Lactuca virosa TaxID=75947 RepID=A0AAU9PNP0_9ASTR|nr:unnamed protein product [Lactuca virosa]
MNDKQNYTSQHSKMTTDNTDGASGTSASPIRSVMSLESITTRTSTPQRPTTVVGEAPQQRGSKMTTAPMSEPWRPVIEGLMPSATVFVHIASSHS